MYPLVLDLAADKIPVAVACGYSASASKPSTSGKAKPLADRDYDDAHLINAAVDVHHDDPEFGYPVERLRTTHDEETVGWLGALTDPRVGPALHAVHADPMRPWSVPELAALAHLAPLGLRAASADRSDAHRPTTC
jgi:hypothetical protein